MFGSPIDLSVINESSVSKKPRLTSNSKVEFDGKEIKECYFSLVKDNTWKCKCGNHINQIIKNGYSNLKQHVKSFHPNYENEIQKWRDDKLNKTNQRQTKINAAYDS